MLGAPVFRTALYGPWSGNALWTAARAVPSLDLCFADKKDLICASSGRQLVTFARASSGTYVDSARVLRTAAVDEPRFDHDPLTGESLGLLVEEQRTNLLLRSEEFDNAGWILQNGATVSANAAISPSGTLSADRLTIQQFRYIYQSVNLTVGITYTLSCYVKHVSGGNQFKLSVYNGTTALTSITQTASSSWQRYSYTFTTLGTSTQLLYPVLVDGLSAGVFDIWGAQLEAGATASSYIPAAAAAATRNADVVSITGTNFSSWYRQDEGTFYYEGTISQGLASFPWFYSINDGTTSNDIGVYQFTNGVYGYTISGNVAATPDMSVLFSPVSGSLAKHALAVKTADSRAALNAALSAAQGSTVMPVVNTLNIGRRTTGNRMTGHIRRLTFWPQSLPGQLQAITQP